MNDEDRLMEMSTKQLPKALLDVGKAIALFLMAPGAAATDPFFRKNMGERYFTPIRSMMSVIVWGILWKISVSMAASFPVYTKFNVALTNITGFCIMAGYVILSILNFQAVKQRHQDRIQWHSRSRGESLFGTEDWRIILSIEIAAAVVLFFVSPPFFLYFIFSRYLSYLSHWLTMTTYHNRYLDLVDAQIDAQYLETALSEGLPPSQTGGIYSPLSNRFKGEYRTNVARLGAGISMPPGGVTVPRTAHADVPTSAEPTPAIPTGSESEPPAPKRSTSKRTRSTKASEPAPAATVPLAAPAPTRRGEPIPETQAIPILEPSTQPVRQTVPGTPNVPERPETNPIIYPVITGFLIISITASAVIYFWPAKHKHHTQPQASSPVYVQPVQPQVIPAPLPPVEQPVAVAQPPAPQPVPVATPAPPPVDNAAILAAQLKQYQAEQARIAQEHQQKIDQFYGLLSQKVADLAQVQASSYARLDDNTNKIKKASWLRRGYLRDKNDEARKSVLKKLQNQQRSLNLVQDDVRAFATDAKADPNELAQTIRIYDLAAHAISQNINLILQNMDDEISGKEENSGLIQVK